MHILCKIFASVETSCISYNCPNRMSPTIFCKGVDTVSCIICSMLGYSSRHICGDIWKVFYNPKRSDDKTYKDKENHSHPVDYTERLLKYHPGAFRTSLFFVFYQIKNTYDTLVWGDGPEFIFHHIFSLLTAYGTMVAGCGHVYAVFFFGMSEISTAVLCLVANFDDKHGVPGLGEAFPTAKVILGATFTILFIIFRCILWPVFGFFCARDLLAALKGADPRVARIRNWLTFSLISLVLISTLQILWLGQIFIIGKKELESAGFL